MLPATRQEQKEATRERLVNAAMELFARNGIAQTTTADIAKSIGMSHGNVFVHFPSREDLVIAVIDELDDAWRRSFASPSRKNLDCARCCGRICECFRNWSRFTRGW